MKHLKQKLLMTALFLLSVMSANANLTWSLDPTGLLKIEGSGYMPDFSFENAPWYQYRDKITSLELSDGVMSIGADAFRDCSNLTSVTIPNSVKRIGFRAFGFCGSLTSITIPNSVTSLEGWTFCGCYSLTSITIPNSVTSIGEMDFEDCTGLSSVIIPNSVTSIGEEAFKNCSGLISVTIPNSVTSLAKSVFSGCSGLISVTIPNSVTSIGDYAFEGCSGLISVTIPNSVTSIGNYAFEYCSGLISVTIPNSVTSIGESAFYGCSGLTEPIIVNDMFVMLPKSYNGQYSIPSGIEKIIGGAFHHCSGLTSVTIPNSVTSIGESAFYNCSGLTSVTIPNSVISIRHSTFEFCSGLTSVTIPNSVTSIGERAFYNCSGLTSVTIPNSVTSIGENAFSFCSGLTSVTIPNSVTSIGKGAFYDCSGLTSITIPNSVKTIGKDAFSYCKKIRTINWDSDINSSPFTYAQTSVNEVTIGDNVNIVYTTFSEMPNLSKIVLGKNVAYLRTDAFKGCGIKEFYVTSEEAPYCYPNVFANVTLSNATLYGPSDKLDYYRTTAPWSEFGKIKSLSVEPESIDLGLSVEWATMNLGASSPHETGELYCMDSTLPQKEWGDDWRMPTYIEIVELADQCTWSTCTVEGVSVFKVVGPNGNYIYLPKTGWAPYSKEYDYTMAINQADEGFYWCSTTHKQGEWTMAKVLNCKISSATYDLSYNIEVNKMGIRPVKAESTGIYHLSTDTNIENSTIYNINGQAVRKGANAMPNDFPAGIYIVNGKKVLVK